MDYEEILLETADKMEKCVEHFTHEMKGVRSGRASPGLVEGIRVNYYGAQTPLGQMAQISVPEPRQLAIKPFDATQIQEVSKAIQASGLGINPSVDGKIIRLTMPPLSEEQRKKLVGLVKEKAEQAKVAIRAVRRDSNKHGDESLKSRVLTEDDLKNLKDEVQESTKEHETKVDEILKKKIDELMTV
ncbi:MAG TPA: ribosome recycling factor [Planctomycetota bacterium]|nr:ribosome recycling factor [Planctomycetota bacterium]